MQSATRVRNASRVRSIRWIPVLVALIMLLAAPAGIHAAGGSKPATKVYNVADTRQMESGPSKWIADVYNDNLVLFGLLVVVVMATMGLVLGLGMDRLITLTGIDLSRLEHHE